MLGVIYFDTGHRWKMSIEVSVDMELGSMLMSKKIISHEHLKIALAEQKIKGGYLSQRLLELGYVKDTDLATCLTCQYGFCYLPLNSYDISEATLEIISPQFACEYCVVPIEINDKFLTVTMSDPLNKGVIEILRQISHCEIVVFVSTHGEIKQAIEKYYKIPYKSFELDKFSQDSGLRDNLSQSCISNGLYSGPNRRRYKRLHYRISGEYYLYPNIIKTKILNVSMSGILFEANTHLPKGAQIAINLHLDRYRFITAVVEVTRCESKNMIDVIYENGNGNHHVYEVGAFFNFLSEENQHMLADFMKTRMNS